MRPKVWVTVSLALIAACSREAAQERAQEVTERVTEAVERVAVPLGQRDDPQERERQRFDERWRGLRSFRVGRRVGTPAGPVAPPLTLRFVRGVPESFKNLDAQAINAAPISVPITGDVSGPSVLKVQVYLDRQRFSPGVIDGRWGRNSSIALWWWQYARGLQPTGAVDEATFRSLANATGGVPALVTHEVTAGDLEGPFRSIPDDIYEKAQLSCLCYESPSEKLAERFHTTREFLELINPNVKFSDLQIGTSIFVPNVRSPEPPSGTDVARVVVSLAGNTLNAYDHRGNLVFHAPTTVGSQYDPSPSETVQVRKVVPDPHFHYQPTLFHEVPDSDPEATLKPGPNSPVGVVWIALSKPHYGIHGTSDPDSIGYASSHGCIRLTNWDAGEIAKRLAPNVPVEFVDTRRG